MKLVLKDRVFDIKCATLSAAIPDPYWSKKYNPGEYAGLTWGLCIDAVERTFDDWGWEPSIYHENLTFPIQRWMDVSGQVVEWHSRYDEETGEPNGSCYVFEHEGISEGKIQFLARDGLKFRVNWSGLCDVKWNDDYGRNVPFTIDAWADFTEVIVRGSGSDSDKSLRVRLAQYLDVSGFRQEPIHFDGSAYDDGVKIARGLFIPIIR